MKSIKIFGIFSIILMTITFISCDQEQVEKSGVIITQASQEDLVGLRTCPITCPLGDCCCAVYLQEVDNSADLWICGTSDNSGSCSGSAVGSCASFSDGGTGGFQLTTGPNSRFDFCMNTSSPFWISNTNSTDTAKVYLTCQGDLTNPQVLQIAIPPGERWYYTTNGSCSLSGC